MPSWEQITAFLSLIFLFIVAMFTANYAEQKGRSPIIWFGLSLLIGLFAPLALWLLPSLREEKPAGEKPRFSSTQSTISPPPIEIASINTPSPTPIEEKLWYYLDQHHQQYGPVSLVALRELWNTGRLELTSYVWAEGMPNWDRVDNLPDLKEALSKTPDYTL